MHADFPLPKAYWGRITVRPRSTYSNDPSLSQNLSVISSKIMKKRKKVNLLLDGYPCDMIYTTSGGVF